MTNITAFATLLAIAEQAMQHPSEASIDVFLQACEKYPDDQTPLETALLDVIGDLTMHEYLCEGEHEHEEAE